MALKGLFFMPTFCNVAYCVDVTTENIRILGGTKQNET